MRVGQNPAKTVRGVPQPAEVTVAVVVYIPFVSGYYADSLEILRICLESIIANTRIPFDLMVFDNASCQEVQEYLLKLHARGDIQYLTLSKENLGKIGAWNFLVGAAPGKVLAYADADVYHFPEWLTPQIDTLKLVPNVGMVTGMPLLAAEEKSSATIAWAEENPEATLERGRLLPWEDFWRHSGTLGRPEEEQRQFFESNRISRISYKGRQYYAAASHFQFVSDLQVLRQFFPLSADRPMGQVRQLDEAINAAGYLRLSTLDWHIQHIGNVLPEDQSDGGIQTFLRAAPVVKSRKKTFWDHEKVQNILHWLHTKTFEKLYRR